MARPRLYAEGSERLFARVPAALAERIRERGIQSQQIATVLEDFLNDDAHLGLVQKAAAVGNAWRQDRGRLEKAVHEARALKGQLLQSRQDVANMRRSFTQLVRNAPAGERRGLIQRLMECKRLEGDIDVDLHTVEDLLRRASGAHMAVAA